MRRIMQLLAILGLTLTGTAAAQSGDAVKQEVMQAVQKMFDAMRARDTAALARVLDPTARLVTTFGTAQAPDMDITTVPQFISLTTTVAPGKLLDERISDPVIQIEDNLAQVWVKYRFYLGDQFSHCGVDAMQLARTINGWQIIALADTRRAGAQCGE